MIYRNASPTNDNDNSSESGSDASSSGDSSSDENSKIESVTENSKWSLMSFVKPDVQPKPLAPIDPLPSQPVPELKSQPDVKSSIANVTTKSAAIAAAANSKKFLSPQCLINEQINQEPIGKSFVSE